MITGLVVWLIGYLFFWGLISCEADKDKVDSADLSMVWIQGILFWPLILGVFVSRMCHHQKEVDHD